MKNSALPFLGLAALLSCTQKEAELRLPVKPNIVIIYCDDLGYGDVGFNGARGVRTPSIDSLAAHGLVFTDAHCQAATCTPSRYSLLTGSYAFRNNAAILPGDAPLIIDTAMATLPSMLQEAGYVTGIVGKWHLGLGNGHVDWNGEIAPGPREVGFDYSFIIPATADRVPCVFVENGKIAGLDPSDPVGVDYQKDFGYYPTGTDHPEMLKMPADPQHSCTIVDSVSRIGYMKGGRRALWKDENFPLVLTTKARRFMDENRDRPFFLYFALSDIHVPRMPNPRFVGKSSMGPRGDAIAEADWCTGQILRALKSLGVENNTLVIFSSDNGPVLDDGYADGAVALPGDHHPAGPYRGGKYSAFEGGTRMPTIICWPGVVKPGKSDALVSQTDLYASLARLTGQELDPRSAPDSKDVLDAWLGRSSKGRDVMLEEAFTLSLRHGNWKYILPSEGSTPQWMKNKNVESGLSPEDQLYNLDEDPGEKVNVAGKYPDKVKQMRAELNRIRSAPSRTGAK